MPYRDTESIVAASSESRDAEKTTDACAAVSCAAFDDGRAPPKESGKIAHSLLRRNYAVDAATVFFGVGSWLAVNGIWTELPVLVTSLPEAWTLPSYLSITCQLANVGAVAYGLLHRYCRLAVSTAILVLMGLGVTACVLLANFWWETAWIGGTKHSVAMLVLVFCLALVDCTSSVTFWPFMAIFPSHYLVTYFVGEGLSGLLPALVALGQGVGGNAQCVVTKMVDNTTGDIWWSYGQYTPPPNFSADAFFYALAAMMAASMAAFIFLRYHPLARREHLVTILDGEGQGQLKSSSSMDTLAVMAKSPLTDLTTQENGIVTTIPEHLQDTEKYSIHDSVSDTTSYGTNSDPEPVLADAAPMSTATFGYLLGLQMWLNFVQNGVLMPVQSYTCLPYGNTAYHLTVTLSNVAATLGSLAVLLIPSHRRGLTLATAAATLVGVYLLTLAVLSPSPPMLGTQAGSALVVVAWVLFTGLLSHTKASLAVALRSLGPGALFWCGAVTQLGSFIGTIIMFVLVDVENYFQSNDPCQPYYVTNSTQPIVNITITTLLPI